MSEGDNNDTTTTTGFKPRGSRALRGPPRRSKSNVDERSLPSRSKSMSGDGAPTKRSLPKRSKSMGGDKLTSGSKIRKKKKGIRVAITVRKREETDEDKPSNEEDLKIYHTEVHCTGKYHRKGCWPDVDCFWVDKTVDKDIMCDLLKDYSENYYPERKGADNVRPKRCYLCDCKMRGITLYKDYSWDPVELQLRAQPNNAVEILESYTKSVTLEEVPIDVNTDIATVLKEQGDKAVTSTLTKSQLQGHPLALAMMASETQIVVELRGLESVVGVLGNDDDHTTNKETNDETGEQTWHDTKTLRAILHDKPVPEKQGKGTQRTVEVVALESYVKARVHYKAYFEGDVVSDHGSNLLLGERWWAHPLKDIMSGFQQDNAAMIYEDIELRFYSEIGYKMDNEWFDWENHNGKWVKVKKTRQP